MTVGIYKIQNTKNGFYYIGSSKNIERRVSTHFQMLKGGYHYNEKIQNDYNKFGKECFCHSIVEKLNDNTTQEELFLIEQKYLDKCNIDKINSYNLTFFTDNRILTPECIDKISKKLKGRKFTKKHKEKISKSLIGRFYSKETRMKIGKKTSERRHTEETKRKIGLSRIGYKHTIKVIEKIRNTNIGKHNKGQRNGRHNKNIYTFFNESINESFIGTPMDFRLKYKIHPTPISEMMNKGVLRKGWKIKNS